MTCSLQLPDRRVSGALWKRVELLWVRWFGRDMEYEGGWKSKRLDRLGYVPSDDDGAFGFIDPSWVIRGVHLTPAFSEGRMENYLPKTSIASDNHELGDWENYYVNRWVLLLSKWFLLPLRSPI